MCGEAWARSVVSQKRYTRRGEKCGPPSSIKITTWKYCTNIPLVKSSHGGRVTAGPSGPSSEAGGPRPSTEHTSEVKHPPFMSRGRDGSGPASRGAAGTSKCALAEVRLPKAIQVLTELAVKVAESGAALAYDMARQFPRAESF